MQNEQPIYVIDTNILVDYVDVIPGEGGSPIEPTVNLDNAHLIIPTVVVRELSNFKGEKSYRGKSARTVLKKLRSLIEDDGCRSLDEIYKLDAPVHTSVGNQLISIMPVHKDFRKCLPFYPSDTDMDGQIILTALAASMAKQGMRIDGTELAGIVSSAYFDNVTVLTNDNGLAIRARERGLGTLRYGYKSPEPYTGRRDLEVPQELLLHFLETRSIDRELFEEVFPGEPSLVANEFIVMSEPNMNEYVYKYTKWNNPFFGNIGRYDVDEDAIVPLDHIEKFNTGIGIDNAGQAIYAEALMNPDIAAVICTGPAGSGKTYMATVYGYMACKAGMFIGVTAVPCENRSNIGALPGDLDEKMDPDVQPLKNALRNYLFRTREYKQELENLQKHGTDNAEPRGNRYRREASVDPGDRNPIKHRLDGHVNMIWDNWFSSIPIEVARGRDFSYELAIYDEFQDQNASQADTLIKRIGKNGKIIITGDIEQIHAPYLDQYNNGIVYASQQLYDNPMVAQVRFTEDEVVRHPLVQEIARRQRNASHRSFI